MPFNLSSWQFGTPRSPQQAAIMRTCEEVMIAFCDLVDAGNLDAATALHVEDLVFYDVGRTDPMHGRDKLAKRLNAVRFCYPGRKTLHTPSNFRFHKVDESSAECRVVISLYDLVAIPGGRGIGAYSTELLGYAAEDIRFVFDNDGRWKMQTRSVRFLSATRF